MARSIQVIQAQIQQIVASQSSLSSLNLSPSQTSIYQLWENIMATELNLEEQLWDQFRNEIDTTISNHAVGSDQWVYDEVFKFQYDALTPQVIQLVNFVPTYNPVDPTKQIITRCSVKTTPSRIVTVKVAKSNPPTALSNLEKSSLQSYLDQISFAGVQYAVYSQPADYLLLSAEIFYNGQYAPTISSTVIAGINAYLANLPFDTIVRVSALEDAIQQIPGVIDIKIRDMAIKASGGSYIYLVQNSTELLISLPLSAGYIVEDPANTFASNLTFTAQ